MTFLKDFSAPPAAYRGKPFWSLNGRLNEDEMRRQMGILQEMGFGGCFIHPRVGLETPYLERPWFDFVAACLDETRRRGLEAWLYDEDRWASGSAGGKATRSPRHRMKVLVLRHGTASRPRALGRPLGQWLVTSTGQSVEDFTPCSPRETLAGPGTADVISVQAELTPCHSWYNGHTYLDTLSADAVQAFIGLTHEAYRKHYAADFGGLIPGIFTDEPNCGFFVGSLAEGAEERYAYLPWTPELPRVFRQRYGYDLRPHLLELFYDHTDGRPCPVRFDFYDCLTHLFTTHYAGQIGAWCRQHGLLFTGHVLFEEPLLAQTAVGGSAMRFYEHMQAPGVDMLTQYRPEYDTVKQCASVAHQTGSRWVLSELYGCTGWDFPFEGHKALGDWQAALGVNLRCHHLAWYTMAGEAKRDYPASIFFQSPWWQHYRVVEDYFARLGLALSEGQPVRRLLVLHPIESMWLLRKPEQWQGVELHPWPDQVADPRGLAERLRETRNWLLDAHLDFDYGDEEMLSRLGAVERRGGRPLLRVGQARYERVLVPQRLTIRAATLALLARFMRAGGEVVFEGDAPELVDGRPSAGAVELARQATGVPHRRERLVAAVEAGLRDVSVLDARGHEIPGVLYMLRQAGKHGVLFFCNTDRRRGHDKVTVRWRARGHVCRLDPETGERRAVTVRDEGDWLSFETSLPATGSRLYLVEPRAAALPPEPLGWCERQEATRLHPAVALSEPNVLVLDRPRARLGAEPWGPPTDILRLDRQARERLGLPPRGGEMVQPWTRVGRRGTAGPSLPLRLEYTFEAEVLPEAAWLVLEQPERYTVELNGQPVPVDESREWVDPALRRLPLPAGALRKGSNQLQLAARFDEALNLESLFVLGDFGVELRNGGETACLTAPVRRLRLGDWTRQGLPFYGGSVSYVVKLRPRPRAGERVVLALGPFDGAMARVRIGGETVGFAAWAPYEVDLTPWAGQGELLAWVEVFGSRRNGFGPLHLTDRQPVWVGPEQFTSEGAAWSDAYQLVPCGLRRAPRLIYRLEKSA